MKKKIFALICCMISIMYVFSGCSLFTEDQDRKLSQTVASVGNVTVSLEKLITSFNNNASTLMEQYSYTQQQAVEYCLKALVTRGIIVENAKELETQGKIVITDDDRNTVVSETVAYFKSLMDAYAEEAMSDLGYTSPESDEEASSNSDYTAETKFEQEYCYKVEKVVENGNVSYELVIEKANEEESSYDYKPAYVEFYKNYKNGENIQDAFFKILDDSYESGFGKELKEKIYDKIIVAYKNSYTSYSSLSRQEIIVKEMIKILDNNIDSIYVDKVSDLYTKNAYNNITIDKVIENYLAKYNASKFLYENNLSSYVSKMLSSAKDVYYAPNQTEVGYFTHVLLKYSDEQSADLKTQKQILTSEEYELYEQKKLKEIVVNKYDEQGNIVASNVTAEEVLSEIQNALSGVKTAQERAEIFNEFVYSYNMDTGNKNADRDYVIGREIKESSDSRSQMVETFTDASRTLLEAYMYTSKGNDISDISNVAKTDDDVENLADGDYVEYRTKYEDYLKTSTYAGEIGAISGLVKSEYGYHIIMFTGFPQSLSLEDEPINENAVALDVVKNFGSSWSSFAKANTNYSLAKTVLVNLVKEADAEASVDVSTITNYFSTTDIKLMVLACYSINLHTSETFLDEALDSVCDSISTSYTTGMYTTYLAKYKNTNQKYTTNVEAYKYLYEE